jgi:hypothetical protein
MLIADLALGAVVPMLPITASLSQRPVETELSGLGLDLNLRDPALALVVGVPLVALSTFGAYHTFSAIGSPGSTMHKVGLGTAGAVLSLVALGWAFATVTNLR